MTHAYQVLARTTRPTKFSQLIGQEALTQTLKNAIESGRLAHAFILTGTRGVGKTTTARLIALALNCVGKDGKGQPTSEPCGECAQCQAISEERHMDVIEVDAATRTGVDDVRQLTEGVSYKPVMGRYKIYIVDEVHMLSKSAFNALLKTLEEPPAHVKFIFATTEIRKVPLTILSRCQRFDLKRVAADVLTSHFSKILEKEKITFEVEALECIAQAAEGSVRDGLSLLEQAIVKSDGKMTFEGVQEMLGLSNQEKISSLFIALMEGRVKETLVLVKNIYMEGADPEVLLQDLLSTTYRVLSSKVSERAISTSKPLNEVVKKVSAESLMLVWQILIKGAEEMKLSSLPLESLEVILIRAMHIQGVDSQEEVSAVPLSEKKKEPLPKEVAKVYGPKTFQDVVSLFEKKREPLIVDYLKNDVGLVHFEPGTLKLNMMGKGSNTIYPKISKLLSEYTGKSWHVEISNEKGQDPLNAQKQKEEENRQKEALETESAKKIAALFPGAQLTVK
jgi:DNA polymerase-3 subunit gamma/tau